MEIFYRLLFGHLLADFTFQTNYLADLKRRKFIGLLIHVLIHPVCYVVLAWPYINDTWRVYGNTSLNGWTCVTIASLIHFFEDWFRVNAVNRGWPDNTVFYLWDQLVHILSLWFLCPVDTMDVINSWPILGCLFVMVTHCATVTVWFVEKDIYGRDFPAVEEKYISILQRLLVWLSFSLPLPWWPLILAFALFGFMRHVWKRQVDYSWASVIMGNVIALGCGFLSRFVVNFHF